MRAAGAPDAVIQAKKNAWMAALPEQPFVEVFPENIAAFRVLMATADQWEQPGVHGGRLALPLQDVDVAMRRLGLPDSEFVRVVVLIRAAREVKFEQLEAAQRNAAAQTSRR